MIDFEKRSWLASMCMGNILFTHEDDFANGKFTVEDLEEELDYNNCEFVLAGYADHGHLAWIIREKPRTLSAYTIDDGYGIVGVGWTCPYCDKNHPFEFVDVDERYICQRCKSISVSNVDSVEWA